MREGNPKNDMDTRHNNASIGISLCKRATRGIDGSGSDVAVVVVEEEGVAVAITRVGKETAEDDGVEARE